MLLPSSFSFVSRYSCFTQHRTLWDLNHVYGSRKRPSAYYSWNKHLKGELGRHKDFIIPVCSLCSERPQMCTHFYCRPARQCSRVPRNVSKNASFCPCQEKLVLVCSCPEKQWETGHHQALSWTRVTPFLMQAKLFCQLWVASSPKRRPVLLMSEAGPDVGISQCWSGSFACVQAVFSDIWL